MTSNHVAGSTGIYAICIYQRMKPEKEKQVTRQPTRCDNPGRRSWKVRPPSCDRSRLGSITRRLQETMVRKKVDRAGMCSCEIDHMHTWKLQIQFRAPDTDAQTMPATQTRPHLL